MKSFKIREKKSFSNYRVYAIKLLREYSKFEKEYCGSLYDEVSELQKSKAIELIRNKGTEVNETDLLTSEMLDLVLKQNQLNDLIKEAKEVFLIDNDYEKAKTLCGIYYEDFTDFEGFEEYGELYEFLMKTFDGFFLNNQNISSTENSMKNDLPIKSPIQTKEN